MTVSDFVPTTFNLLVARLERDPEALRRVSALRHLVVGGEEISPRQVHRLRELLPGLRVSNAYGPSETTIGMVFHDGPRRRRRRRAARPARSTTASRSWSTSGCGRCRPARSARSPSAASASAPATWARPDRDRGQVRAQPVPRQVPGERLYRSGDLGWYDPQGRLHFGGRRDFQAKVGGVRIELGEVEVAAEGCPGVRQATVLVAGTDAARGLAVFAAGRRDGDRAGPAGPPAPGAAAHLAAPARGACCRSCRWPTRPRWTARRWSTCSRCGWPGRRRPAAGGPG